MNTTTLRGLRATCQYQRNFKSLPRMQYSFYTPAITHSIRYASTAPTAPTPKAISNASPVNGPLTTLPAPLTTPTRKPDQALPSYLFALGKSYVAFYKNGVKNIYANHKASRPIQQLINTKYNSSLNDAVKAGALTRSEFQLLARNWHDIKRVPMFGLVLMVFGEFTPLVVIVMTSIVPWTCRIPKQILADREKLESRRRISFRNLTAPPPSKAGTESLERMQLLHISWSLGLSSSAWDYLGGQLPGLPTSVLRKKVEGRVRYLEMDDGLIGKAGGVKDMDADEVKMALVERGVDILGKDEKSLKGELNAWLKSREKIPTERLLLTRPSAWPVRLSDAKTKL